MAKSDVQLRKIDIFTLYLNIIKDLLNDFVSILRCWVWSELFYICDNAMKPNCADIIFGQAVN